MWVLLGLCRQLLKAIIGWDSGVCSARQIRWSPSPSSAEPTPDAGLEECIGRCNTICDAGVTRRLMLQMTEQHG
jgi:hypothetical protein